MIARILRIELRRSAALWAALVSIPIAISYQEVGQGLSNVAATQRSMLATSIPLMLAVGAWQSLRERRSRLPELIATTPRPAWQRLLPTAAALAIGALSGSVLLLACLAAVAGAAATGPGLAGADLDLDRTARIAWPPRRAAHITVAAIVVAAIVAATALTGMQLIPAARVIRDVIGMSGLIAFGAVVIGAGRAWILPLTWTLLAMQRPPSPRPHIGRS